jgi:hypothetical protein
MNRLKEWLICGTLCASIVFTGALIRSVLKFGDTCDRVAQLADQAGATMAATTSLEASLQREQVRTQAEIVGAANAARHSLRDLDAVIALVQNQTLPQFNTDNHKVMTSLDALIRNGDADLGTLTQETRASIADFDKGTQALVAATIRAETDADKLFADPVMLGNLQAASGDFRASMAHLVPILADLEAEQHDVRGWVHRITAPVSAGKQALITIGKYATSFGGAVVGSWK